MAIGEVPVRVMCESLEGFKLHVEDVDGVTVPKMSLSFSMKMSFPIHDLLKTLVSWQEHETGFAQEPSQQPQQAVAAPESRRRAQEACEAVENPASPLLNAPLYADYKSQNNWERISCPHVVLLDDEIALRQATFAPLQAPDRVPMTYAKFKEARSKPGADSAPAPGKGPQMKVPPTNVEKAPPAGWRTPPAAVKPVPPASIQHKPPPMGKPPPKDGRY
ncbi:unnamed protein product [Symbiodinium natans]|uniref:Uncharacterized protein n=1 Tax=Symbiodinium natans TaxID=878477 RepID=A0A812PIA8_9DINO|nr:unnamed protein product [Symbiodinium natans]